MNIQITIYETPLADYINMSPAFLFTLSGAMNEIVDFAKKTHLSRFRKEVDPDYRPWVRWAQSTQKQRGQRAFFRFSAFGRNFSFGGSARILYQSGRLEKSMKFKDDRGGKFNVYGYSDVEYASYHQEGTPTIPVRQFMGFGDKDLARIEEIFDRAIAKAEALETIVDIATTALAPGAKVGGLTGSVISGRAFGTLTNDPSFVASKFGFFDNAVRANSYIWGR